MCSKLKKHELFDDLDRHSKNTNNGLRQIMLENDNHKTKVNSKSRVTFIIFISFVLISLFGFILLFL